MNRFTKPQTSLISLVILLLLIFRLLGLVSNYHLALGSSFNLPEAQTMYEHSQYNLGQAEFFGNINDDILYTYAGIRAAAGADPSLINPETPYLIKYLYGFSVLIFGNAVIIQALFSLGLLVVTGYLAYLFTGNPLLSLLSASLLTFDKVFIDQSFASFLDLPHALFIVSTFIAFTLYSRQTNPQQARRLLIITGALVGAVAATKFFATALVLYLVFLLFLQKTLSNLLRLTTPALLVYLASFLAFFYHHPNPLDFLTLHFNLLKLYKSYLPAYPQGEFLRIIFLGEWRTWWGSDPIIKVSAWTLIWPVTTATSLLAPLLLANKQRTQILPMFTFITLYLFTNLFHVIFPRYLLSILPLLIVVTIFILSQITGKINKLLTK